MLDAPLDDLLAAARERRRGGGLVTFSPKVFIPLTTLCRDVCGYCTFARPPRRGERAFMTEEEVLVEARLRVPRHPCARLGAEVLDDHLLQVAVTLVHRTERLQRLDPLGARLADPDQDPARERDPQLAGERDRLQPARRHLVG